MLFFGDILCLTLVSIHSILPIFSRLWMVDSIGT